MWRECVWGGVVCGGWGSECVVGEGVCVERVCVGWGSVCVEREGVCVWCGGLTVLTASLLSIQ